MMPINRPVRVVTRDGAVINGRRLNEDTYTVQLIDDQRAAAVADEGGPARVHDSDDVADAVIQRRSSADEIADLVAYLLSLKGR